MDYLKTYCEKKASARTRRALRELKLKGGNIVSGVGLANRERTLNVHFYLLLFGVFRNTYFEKHLWTTASGNSLGRCSTRQVFIKNFSKYSRKHLYWSLSVLRLLAEGPPILSSMVLDFGEYACSSSSLDKSLL